MLLRVTRNASGSTSRNTCEQRSSRTSRGTKRSTLSTLAPPRTTCVTPRSSRGIWATRTASTLLAAVVVAGCGGSDDDRTPAGQIHDVFQRFAEAVADKDWDRVCELYTPQGRASITQAGAMYGAAGSCGDALSKLAPVVSVREFSLTDVKVTGATATGTNPKAADPDDRLVRFARTDQGWRIAVDGEPNREGSP